MEQGNLAQLNAGSITGLYGSDIKNFAEKLVKMNLIHVLGSDGHNVKGRPTKIIGGYRRVGEINPELHKWIIENEKKIIYGEEVEVLEIKKGKKKKSGFFSFFTGR